MYLKKKKTCSSPEIKSRKIRYYRIIPLLPDLADYIQGSPRMATPILTKAKPEIHFMLKHLTGTMPVPLLPQAYHILRSPAPMLSLHTPILQREILKVIPEPSQVRIIHEPHPLCLLPDRRIRLGRLRRLISQAHSLLI